jgi:hypothetical protein
MVMGAALAACGGGGGGGSDAGPTPLPGTYENVASIMMTGCAFNSCHGGSGQGASMLNLQTAIADGTLVEDLVDVPSCQYSAMPLIDPGDPDNSWLWIKVAGAHDAMGRLEFTPDPSWEPGITPDAMGNYPSSTCPLTQGGDIVFGTIMPQGAPNGLDASRAATIREWIEAGAPGPTP